MKSFKCISLSVKWINFTDSIFLDQPNIAQRPSGNWDVIYEDLTFTQPLSVGNKSNVLIYSCHRKNNDTVYGNIMVDLRSTSKFWKRPGEIEYNSNNFLLTHLDEFVDLENDDFHLKSTSDLIANAHMSTAYISFR